MGRHAVPESEDVTVQFAVPHYAGAGQREIDLGAWWESTKPNTRVWMVLGAAAAVMLGFGAVSSAGSGHTTSTDPSSSARSQGWSYGKELRDEGYDSMSVIANCSINADGYSGSYWSDYSNGCVGVALQMMDHGR